MALQHLRSSTLDKRPTPGAMSDGQLALNTNLASPGLFFKDSNGDSVKIGPVHVGTTAPNVTPGAGGQAGNSKGEAWLDTSAANPILKVFNGSAFVAVQPVGTGTVVSTTDTGTVTSTMILDGTILNADINASAAIVDTKLDTIATAGKVSNSATTATSANTNSAIVARDASGNFTAGTVTANLIDASGITTSGLNGGPLAGFRNRIINGNFDIAQRGTSFAAIANAAYSLDRWTWGQAGAMVCTVTQSTDVPNNTFQSSYKVDVTTVDSSIAAGDYAFISQKIEGYNVRDLIGTTFTVSFWVKSPKTGVHCVSFSNSGQNRSYIKEYTIAVVNTWEYKTVTVTGGLITAGTWNWTNGEGLEVGFSLATGSTYQTTSDAWQTGDFLGTANQVNVMDNTANDFFLTGVQLEPGTVATPFERRSYGQELTLCQRYFEKSYGQSQALGTIEENHATWGSVNSADTTLVVMQQTYKVTKRVAPTVTVYNTATGGTGTFIQGASTATVLLVATGESIMGRVYATAGMTSGTYVRFHWTASAEL
jgi:hypothetical protein